MAPKITTQTIETLLQEAKALVAAGATFVTLNADGTVEPTDPQTLAASFFPEPDPPAPSVGPMTREQMLACFQPLPASVTSKRHRLEFLLDDVILASKDDPTTNAAAWYLRGRIWQIISKRRQNAADLREYVTDHVMMQREKQILADGGHMCEQCHDQPATRMNGLVCSNMLDAWMCERCYEADRQMVEANVARERAERQGKHWNPQTRQWEPEPPEPTTPASAHPVTPAELAEAVAYYDQWEQGQAFWREYTVALPHILNHWDAVCANWEDADGDWDGWDEWEAHQRERAYKAAKVVAA